MASILGIATIKQSSQEVVTKTLIDGFAPTAGTAISINSAGVVVPFDNAGFYGFVCGYDEISKNVTIIKAGLGVPVRSLNNVVDGDDVYLDANGVVSNAGVEINGMIESIELTAFDGNDGTRFINCVTISFGTGNLPNIVTPPPAFDFNQQDFLVGDFA